MPVIEIYRVRIGSADVDRLLEIRGAAVAEFQEQVPELLPADLVRLDDDQWLDILTWSEPAAARSSSDPSFAAPREVWERVRAACPDLLA